METSNKNKKSSISSPVLVSTNCSGFKSFYITCCHLLCKDSKTYIRPSIKPVSKKASSYISINTSNKKPSSPPPPPPPTEQYPQNHFTDGKEAAYVYWKRVRQLELDLLQINKWIDIEKNLRDYIDSRNEKKNDKLEGDHRSGISNNVLLESKLMRLVSGEYVYVTNKSRPWGRMAMQISAPKIVYKETGSSTAFQVLQQMASMGASRMSCWLLESMPMGEFECENLTEKVSRGFEKNLMESILRSSIKKMEVLALEGLSIMMGAKGKPAKEKTAEMGKECVIIAVLIQMRDPEERYKSFGDVMIGLVEVSVAEESGFYIEGVHVAGIWNGFQGPSEKIRAGKWKSRTKKIISGVSL
ncbi:hypothetical protein C5167_034275 [Papaver somniferum]|uniref:PMI1/PMIR1-2 C-terminal domain-containing protein n=1 Tax=Papaver somniferum TaxID=3469 RepID=A0A4Y7KFH4_PAPSO|nr:uncharacterized protein LOC113293235 [Papaver somniferum]RZC71100.1 hypothetical protein C5167_034275 [Papaver somniferum]